LYSLWEELPENDFEIMADFDSLLNRIHHDINMHQTKLLIENAKNDLVKYDRRQYFMKLVRNAAAILLIPVLGLGLFFSYKYYSVKSYRLLTNQAYNEVFSSFDAITKITLPDRSTVWLNHNSSLRYPSAFTEKSRTVELKGEGFFDVIHNSGSPFIVSAGGIQVIAHGTKFNVMAYPDENKVEATLITGSVELMKSLPDKKIATLYKMNPDDHTVFYKDNNETVTTPFSDERYFSWKEGKLIFTAEPMGEVVKKLSRWFNVDIQIKDPELYDITLTATFVHETLHQVMGLLTIVSPVNFYITDRKMNADGTFSKPKVILSYRNK
jgi:ferric-dicitrate binding protein FerR (iron transport regulator)